MCLEVKDLKKSYGQGESRSQVLKGISVKIEEGRMCVILGPSGSGKSTLLNIIGGLEEADAGEIQVFGTQIDKMKPRELLEYRRKNLGFVFQFYNLIPNLTVKENIQVCQYLSGEPLELEELIQTLGLSEHRDKMPSQLSGGQQQRCAIARALVKNPKLLLCDEPTGALDSVTSREILTLLETINKTYGTTMLIVTHNTAIKDMVHQVIKIRDGQIAEDRVNLNRISAAELEEL
ncbi:ABC transporter ATP-binding protein [bacterium 210820-DFI.6.37]|nr:ABC transporter ATP-binding protein [bacterium 210820-DFI.6.37]